MIKAWVFAVLLLVGTYGTELNEYDVDLDAPPMHRYDHIVKDYLNVIHEVHDEVMTHITSTMKAVLATIFHTVTVTFHREQADEIRGLALATQMSDTDMFILNCVYELRTLCTSIVARDAKGKVILARNLDFGFEKLLRRVEVILHYKRQGSEVCRCAGMAGFIGFMTCIKPNAFAVSLNARRLLSEVETLKAFFLGRQLVTWLIRQTVLTAKTYSEALDQLTKASSVSGSYLAIAGIGPNEGAILTRGREHAIDVQKLNSTAWYIAQCNRDRWNGTDERTTKAHEWMDQIGPIAVSLDKIAEDVLLRPPVLQKETIITALISPVDNYMKVRLQETDTLPPSSDSDVVAY
jgi:hypothetical protein